MCGETSQMKKKKFFFLEQTKQTSWQKIALLKHYVLLAQMDSGQFNIVTIV